MQGRLENELRIKEKIKAKLNEMPSYVEEWYCNMSGSNKTASTCLEYIHKIHKFLSYISKDVKSVTFSDFTPAVFDGYFESIKTKTMPDGTVEETTISLRQTTWSALCNFCSFLYKRKYIDMNYVSENIIRPRGSDLDRINDERIMLTKEDFSGILEYTKTDCTWRSDRDGIEIRDYAILLLFMSTGMRKTALASINLEDVDFDSNILRVVDKGNVYRKCVMSHKLEEALRDWLDIRDKFCLREKETNALFISTRGNRMSSRAIDRLVEKHCEKVLHKHISPHKLRSGFITIMVNETGNIALASKMVGHKSIATTNRYYATGGKESEQAASIIDSIL